MNSEPDPTDDDYAAAARWAETATFKAGDFIVIHHITIVPSPKMDAQDLVAAVCTCGLYRSSPTTENEARKAGQAHVDAKTRTEER